jgi:hypothetical protein
VIVTCPACQVNYRMPSAAKSARYGKCSRCEVEFRVTARSTYKLVAAALAGQDLLSATAGSSLEVPDMPALTRLAPAVPQSKSVATRELSKQKDVSKGTRGLVICVASLVMVVA